MFKGLVHLIYNKWGKNRIKTLNGTSLNTRLLGLQMRLNKADAVIIDARNVGITAEQAN